MMKRSMPYTTCSLVLCLASHHAIAQSTPDADPAATQSTTQPNIIFILADDLGYGDLSVLGQTNFATPHIDAMAAQGILFTQAYCGSTVCAPSRAALLTGQHTGHVFQRGNGTIQFREDPLDITIATRLQQAGYTTAMIGKSGLACLSDDAGLPNRKGFDHFYGYLDHGQAHRHYPPELIEDGEVVTFEGNHGRDGDTYAAPVLTEHAIEWIDEQNGPFFVHLSYTIPHADIVVPDRWFEQFSGRFDERPHPPGDHYTQQPEPNAAYAGMVTCLDDQVGELLAYLEESGLDENTIVFFATDNGPATEGGYHRDNLDSNGPLRGGKRDMYEGGLRTPLIVWAPGMIEAGQTSEHVTAFWDFAPTACELAGIDAPDEMDGISLVPTLLGDGEQAEHDYLYWEFYEWGGSQAIRMGDWKGVRLNISRDPDAPLELYNLAEDPGEEHNVAAEHPDVVEQLEALMEQAHTPSERFSWD